MAQARRRLAERRQQQGWTQEKVANLIGADVSTVARHETGQTMPGPGMRRRYAETYGWTMEQLDAALNGGDPQPPTGQVVPEWLTLYASLEQGASRLWAWLPGTVHALLQTPAYAAAVEWGAPPPITADSVARHVELRLARQAVLDRHPEPLHLDVVLDESVLHRVTGGHDVMVEQLEHLACAAERRNVELRILPLATGIHAATFGAFTLIASHGPGPQLASTIDRTGVRYLEGTHAIDAHMELFEHLAKHSTPPGDTPDLIRTTIKEHYS